MRLKSTTPDPSNINIRHMIYICRCGQTSNQLIEDKEIGSTSAP